jgi:hypothetical protein
MIQLNGKLLKKNIQGNKMRAHEFIIEGGWANPLTQETHITPQLVERVFVILREFISQLNHYLDSKDIPKVELGSPCGSTTYYKRDLVNNPTREYGDIDVNLFIPKIDNLTNNANSTLYQNNIKEFCEDSADFQTSNGTNVIVKINNDYVQVDLIVSYLHNKAWTSALAPEYNIKGVLCNSIYSSLGEALNLSIGGGHGVQVKFQHGSLVPFRSVKNVELKTLTNNPKTWAVDICKFFGCKKISKRLQTYLGMIGEVRVADMINSIIGIAETLELNGKISNIQDGVYTTANDLLHTIKTIYLFKIEKGINSSKFGKASTPLAIQKAEDTKKMLATKSAEIARLFDRI